ncbi:hypothetical protein ACERIT_08825 [Halopenitus sp. H-Gu1]|uniref:hypothetical protein n=1 Tax=Halopenitus sp. H-Gu1 TaxID=3242697 RepID=UPI00359DAB95
MYEFSAATIDLSYNRDGATKFLDLLASEVPPERSSYPELGYRNDGSIVMRTHNDRVKDLKMGIYAVFGHTDFTPFDEMKERVWKSPVPPQAVVYRGNDEGFTTANLWTDDGWVTFSEDDSVYHDSILWLPKELHDRVGWVPDLAYFSLEKWALTISESDAATNEQKTARTWFWENKTDVFQ